MTFLMTFHPPQTETVSCARPLVRNMKLERGTVSSDPELRLAEEFLRGIEDCEPPVIEQAVATIRRIRSLASDLPIPRIASGPDGLVGMTWESAREHVNVQVHPDRRIEYFAEDLLTGALWSAETPWGSLEQDLTGHLQRTQEG